MASVICIWPYNANCAYQGTNRKFLGVLKQESPYLWPVMCEYLHLLEPSANRTMGQDRSECHMGIRPAFPLEAPATPDTNLCSLRSAKSSTARPLLVKYRLYHEIHLRASIWSRASWRQDEQGGSQPEGSCSLSVRTRPEQVGCPEGLQIPAAQSRRLPRIAQISALRSNHSTTTPVSFYENICSRIQTLSRHSRCSRESSVGGSWAPHHQLQYRTQNSERLGCVSDFCIC